MNVTVVLVNWNGCEWLPTTLASIPQNCHVWIVDNGSSDNSVDYIKTEHPHIHLIENDHNKGFGNANNQALEQIDTHYVLMLNTDATLKEGALEKAVDYMNNNSQVGLLGARLINEDGSLQNSITHKIDFLSECLNRNLMSALRGEKRKTTNTPTEVPGVVGAAMLARMSDLKEVGFFDPDYFFFFEETDLCFRLNDAGKKVMHHPEFVVIHAQGKSAAKNKLNARIEYHRSRELFFFKRHGRLEAKRLQLWQSRRIAFSDFFNKLSRVLTLSLHKPRKYELIKGLRAWYRLGCPTNQGLRSSSESIITSSEKNTD